MRFTADVGSFNGKTVVTLAGAIDEYAKFPPVTGDQDVIIDFNQVKYIDPTGIKLWLAWIKPISDSRIIEFINCPKAIILQINMVRDFLPKNAVVNSFYLPLYCESCDREQQILLAVDFDVVIGEDESVTIERDLSQLMECSNNVCDVKTDVIEKKYFRFLTDKK